MAWFDILRTTDKYTGSITVFMHLFSVAFFPVPLSEGVFQKQIMFILRAKPGGAQTSMFDSNKKTTQKQTQTPQSSPSSNFWWDEHNHNSRAHAEVPYWHLPSWQALKLATVLADTHQNIVPPYNSTHKWWEEPTQRGRRTPEKDAYTKGPI